MVIKVVIETCRNTSMYKLVTSNIFVISYHMLYKLGTVIGTAVVLLNEANAVLKGE